jgi:transcriptional regulator with XRE-family HTH domain
LREWREEFGLTQKELIALVGCSRMAVQNIENGTTPSGSVGHLRIANALGIEPNQIVGESDLLPAPPADWAVDGYSIETPRQTLRWWRNKRSLSQPELARLAGFSVKSIQRIEHEVVRRRRPTTRRRLAQALRISPDKLVLPGDKAVTSEERSVEDVLRAELRGTRRALRRSYDFLRDDANIALKALDKRDVLLGDVEKELRGT